ncbi:uncharacterized protein [Ptychodera flava]|uniref:uncharacterized protein n=1 Tax=Ptychodera flava TaxID=63121 RepID=UPI00396A1AA5
MFNHSIDTYLPFLLVKKQIRMEDRHLEFTIGTTISSALVLFTLQVIAVQASQLCGNQTNGTVNSNCTNTDFISNHDVTEPENLTFTGKYTTTAVGRPEAIVTTEEVTTEANSEDALRFFLIGLVIALGILGVVVLIVIRRKSTIRYNKTRKQSLVKSNTDPEIKVYKYHPYYATLNQMPNGSWFSTKSSISERGQYGDDV